MPTQLQVITGRRAYLSDTLPVGPATIRIGPDGRILHISREHTTLADHPDVEGAAFYDAGDLTLFPGLVDAHVHLNEPGRTEWEGFATGTEAAAKGGCTTIIDMPLNAIPPTTTISHLDTKWKAAQGQCHVDVALWGGIIPGNDSEIRPMNQRGVHGFKGFLIESGVPEFPHVSETDIRKAFEAARDLDLVLMFHAEIDLGSVDAPPADKDPREYATFLQSRPDAMEREAIDLIIHIARDYPSVRSHIVHLSTSSALPALRAAQHSGLLLSAETCAHYLTLDAASIPDGATQFKCCPPIRSKENQEALWEALLDGTLSMVVSDHSPCVAELKKMQEGDFMGAWGGIGGVGFTLPLLWTEAHIRGVGIDRLVGWLCRAPALHAGLALSKGTLAVGMDADLLIWDPEEEHKVAIEDIKFKNKVSPYLGRTLLGRVHRTILRGRTIYHLDHGLLQDEPQGRVLLQSP